jgi:acylphosphatase
MTQVARHVRVYGQVQGVFYRAWTREQADELKIMGWVRNCPDGRV